MSERVVNNSDNNKVSFVKVAASMLGESRRQVSSYVPAVDTQGTGSQSIRKLTFGGAKGKKGQTPKKKAAFTPLRLAGDVKPKVEPESPTSPSRKPQAVEPDLIHDVKPNLAELGDALGGLSLESPSTPVTPVRSPVPKREPVTETPMHPAMARLQAQTPLFLPNDSPASYAPTQSGSSSPSGQQALDHESPYRVDSPPVQDAAPSKSSGFGLFSDDSPPPKRETLSPQRDPVDTTEDVKAPEIDCCAPKMEMDQTGFGLFSDDSPPAKREYRSRSATPAYDSDADGRVTSSASSSRSRMDSESPILGRALTARQEPARTAVPPSASKRPRPRAFLEFLEKVGQSDEGDDTVGYDYDSSASIGSLKDFLVDDDDDVEYNSDDDELPADEFDDEEEEVVSRPTAAVKAEIVHLEEWADSDEETMPVDEEESEDEDEDDLLDAIDNLTLTGPTTLKKHDKKAEKPVKKSANWKIERVRIAQEVFDDLDKRVFEGRLGPDGAGAKIIWNKRLLTTAGTAHRKRHRRADGTSTLEVGIQLSEKVCTGEEQILSTVAHEMCHLACWVIDNEFKSAHGPRFKAWGRKVERKRSDLEVTTKHNYIIEYKYKWQCVGCRKVYGRHSKSIDILKNGCGVCKGKLEPMFSTAQRPMNRFQVYLKQNMATAKASMPGAAHGDVMRALSSRWSEAGPEADHEGHWKAVLAASRA